jgi:Macrocin-O-methyltransferase (TylF)/Glycosyltransferase family 9 (heptosyltransferase)
MEMRTNPEPFGMGRPSPPEVPTLVVSTWGHGIGDTVMAVGCVRALEAERPGYRVLLACRPGEVQWARLFLTGDQVVDREPPASSTYRPVETYPKELEARNGAQRCNWYAAACGSAWLHPEPIHPPDDAVRWAERWRGCVVLAPWCTVHNREWLTSRWIHLVRELAYRGYESVVISDAINPGSDPELWGTSTIRVATAEQIGALFRVVTCVIGNDSGMAHVAGGLRRPAIVLCGQQRGETIYGCYPSVRVVNGPLPCSGCHWRGHWGWHPQCDHLCASLQAIEPGQVADLVPPYSCLPEDRRRVLAESMVATAHLGGGVAELGVFRGGSARIMAANLLGRPLHLFDTFAGLPTEGPRAGQYAARLELVRAYLRGYAPTFHVGTFPARLPDDPIRYSCVHLDADLYQSTWEGLAYFWPRLLPGGHLVLDDVGREPGVDQALAESGLAELGQPGAPGQLVVVKPAAG